MPETLHQYLVEFHMAPSTAWGPLERRVRRAALFDADRIVIYFE